MQTRLVLAITFVISTLLLGACSTAPRNFVFSSGSLKTSPGAELAKSEGDYGPISFEYPIGWRLSKSSTFEGYDILSKDKYYLGSHEASNVLTIKRIQLGSASFSQFKSEVIRMNRNNLASIRNKITADESDYPQFKNIEIEELLTMTVNDIGAKDSFHTIVDAVFTVQGQEIQWHTETIFIKHDSYVYTASFSYPPSQKNTMQIVGNEYFLSIRK